MHVGFASSTGLVTARGLGFHRAAAFFSSARLAAVLFGGGRLTRGEQGRDGNGEDSDEYFHEFGGLMFEFGFEEHQPFINAKHHRSFDPLNFTTFAACGAPQTWRLCRGARTESAKRLGLRQAPAAFPRQPAAVEVSWGLHGVEAPA